MRYQSSYPNQWFPLFPVVLSPTGGVVKVCKGDPLAISCVTDTGKLVWSIKSSGFTKAYTRQLITESNDNEVYFEDTISFRLINVSGNVLTSVATAIRLPLSLSGTVITCSDHLMPEPNMVHTTLLIQGIIICLCYYILIKQYLFIFYRSPIKAHEVRIQCSKLHICNTLLDASKWQTQLCTQLWMLPQSNNSLWKWLQQFMCLQYYYHQHLPQCDWSQSWSGVHLYCDWEG